MSAHSPRHRGLCLLVADEDKQALDDVARLLQELGHEVLARAVSTQEVAAEISKEEPDVALVKLHNDEDHALELIDQIVEEADCPVLALMEGDDMDFISRAAEKGIYAYVRPVTKDALQGAIDIAVRRRAEMARFEEAVAQLEGALDRRALIERAKGILIERHGISEHEAFQLLRAHARSNNRRVAEVALSVTEGVALLPKEGAER
jgi:AmiR/NasT family two-component response regulator